MSKKDFKRGLIVLAVLLQGAFMTSCSSNDDGGDGGLETRYDLYISFRADGELVEMGISVNEANPSYLYSSSFSGAIGEDWCYRNYAPGLTSLVLSDDSLEPGAEIFFYRFLEGSSCSADDETPIFNSLFPVGNYAYSDDLVKGVGFGYVPSSGEDFYLSAHGDQTGSGFEITSSVEANSHHIGDLYNFSQVITGTFNCTVYNDLLNPTNSIEITEGRFKLQVNAFYQNFLD